MGTGTLSDGGHRPTPARRCLAVVLALLAVLTTTLAAPSYTAANGHAFQREVRFPSVENALPPLVQYECDYAVANPCTVPEFDQVGQPSYTVTAAHSGIGGRPVKGDSKLTHTEATDSTVGKIAIPIDPNWPLTFEFEASYTHLSCNSGCTKTFTAHWYTGSWGGFNPGTFTFLSSSQSSAIGFTSNQITDSFYIWQDEIIPPTATGVLITSDGPGVYSFRLTTRGGEDVGGGDCIGVAGATGDPGLVWGAPGLTSMTHDQWGDHYSPVREACVFTQGGAYSYVPPEGFTAGDTFNIAAEIFTHSGGTGRFTAWWTTNRGNVSIANQTTQAITSDATTAPIMAVDVPAGTSAITLIFTDDTWLRGVYIANVEGDPTLDTGENPSTYGDNFDAGERFAECSPPADAIDVPGWLAYGACLVINGFLMVVEWIGAIPGDLAEVLGGVIGPVVMDWTAAALAIGAQVAAALLGPVEAMLEFLFVPGPGLGASWDEFMDMVGSRAPFGWFGQVSDMIAAGMAAPAAALGAYTLSIGSASVSIGGALTAALGAVAPFRGLIMAGVALAMVLGCLRWIMAAVGVSPSHSGDGGAA